MAREPGAGSVSAPRSGCCAIAIMAKAPRVGEAKTRLMPALSAEEAAGLSACFIRDAAENIAAAAQRVAIEGYIAYLPAGAPAPCAPPPAAGGRRASAPPPPPPP